VVRIIPILVLFILSAMMPSCTFFLGALLVVVASAQWPRLPNIDPGHIAGVVKSAEKEVKQTLSQKKTQDFASEVAKEAKDLRSQAPSVKDSVAQSAAQAASAAAQTVEAAKTVAEDTQSQQHVGAIGGPPALTTVAPAPAPVVTTAAPAPAPVVSAGSHDTVHTDELLETVQGQINPSKIKEVLGDAAINVPEIADKNIKKAKDSLQHAHDIVQANKQQVEDLASMGQDLASKIIPGLNPSKAMDGVSKVVDGASKHGEMGKPIIHEVVQSDPQNVAHTAEKGVKEIGKSDPNSVKQDIKGDDAEKGEPEDAAEWVGLRWQWSLLFIVVAVGALFFGWQVTKRRDSRSPTLIAADGDMAPWMGGSPSRSTSRQPQSEETLFRQF